jgi:peptidoglycan/xylan/chitin deacetylase (PgdA/CDA1 family)
MYHKIAVPKSGSAVPHHFVHPLRFRSHIKTLKRLGFESVRLGTLFDEPLPKRPIGISFDDGYENFYHHALPVFQELGMFGTVYLVVDRIGESDLWDTHLGTEREPLMSLDQIRTSVKSGIEMGSHSRTHAHLPQCNPEELQREIAGSKERLSQLLGQPITTFCYPYGDLNGSVRAVVGEAGYHSACTTQRGSNDARSDRLMLCRANIRSDTWTPSLLLKLLRPVRHAQ